MLATRVTPRPGTQFRLLRCIIFSRPMTAVGQNPPPNFVAGMEELASIPDADEANCRSASGCRSHRPSAASPRRRVLMAAAAIAAI
jgi:hypothetical protein